MMIRKLDPATFDDAFGILCKQIYPIEGIPKTPFNALWNLVDPGGATRLHRHHEGETFIVVRGQGRMTAGDESQDVEVGDVIFMEPFTDHTLANRSETEQLLFLNIYWEDMELVFDGGAAPEPASGGTRVAIFGSPPNPNGDLHLGHLAGPYMSADVYARFRRMQGDDAHYVLGTDDNQMWTAVKAAEVGESAQEVADHYAEEIQETLRRADAEVSHFYRPTRSDHHVALVEEMVRTLYDKGALIAKDAPALVCENCDRYLFEFWVLGTCPHCGEGTYGNGCESCGRPNDVVDLVDPTCRTCDEPPTEKPIRRLYFPLSRYQDELVEYVKTADLTTQHRALLREMIEAGLPDVVASHPSGWGIPVPIDGFEDQSVSAWIEMAPGYVAGTAELADRLGWDEGWDAFWRSDDGEVVQFYGSDNGWNHGLLYPALFAAFDADMNPPRAAVVNQLYRLEGEKFSTSRGHAVWARDLISEAGPDPVRLFLAWTAPGVEKSNFARAEFDRFVERELRGRWEGWLRDLGTKLAELYDGVVPEAGTWTDDHRRFVARLGEILTSAEAAYRTESFSLQKVVRLAAELVREAREFAHAEDAWGRTDDGKDERRTSIALELAAVRVLAQILHPLAPGLARRLRAGLGEGVADGDPAWETVPGFVEPGTRVESLVGDGGDGEGGLFPLPDSSV